MVESKNAFTEKLFFRGWNHKVVENLKPSDWKKNNLFKILKSAVDSKKFFKKNYFSVVVSKKLLKILNTAVKRKKLLKNLQTSGWKQKKNILGLKLSGWKQKHISRKTLVENLKAKSCWKS